jgi:hypothetical protein
MATPILLHVYRAHTFGYADFIRAISPIKRLAESNGYIYHITLDHPIKQFLDVSSPPYEIIPPSLKNIGSDEDYKYLEGELKKQPKKSITIDSNYSNWFEKGSFQDVQTYIKPSSELQTFIQETLKLLNLSPGKFIVFHIRCGDEDFKEVNDMRVVDFLKRVREKIGIIRFQRAPILVLSSCQPLLEKIRSIPNLYMTGFKPIHVAHEVENPQALKETLTEFYLMSFAKKIYSMSGLGFGKGISGFSHKAAKVFNIPYAHFDD